MVRYSRQGLDHGGDVGAPERQGEDRRVPCGVAESSRGSERLRGAPWERMDDGDDGRRTGDGRATDGRTVWWCGGARGDGSGGGGLRTLTVCGGRSEDLVRTLEISPWGTFGDFLTGERALSVWKPLFATNVTLR